MNMQNLMLTFFMFFSCTTLEAETVKIRLGVLSSGTLSWELAAMQHENLPDSSGLVLESIPLTDQQAGKVALQAGSVDIIISDWVWVSSMRLQGRDYSFYPYSSSAGGLMVPANSPIKTLSDLQGKKLGIAGGELDKNWAILQALALQQKINLNQALEKVYAAPPLLNQQLLNQRIDALLTYWQFAARLEAQGYRQLLSGEEMIQALGVTQTIPSLGYVFKQSWADQNKAALQLFLKKAQAAKNTLCDSQQAWQKIIKLTETQDVVTQQQLRTRYCQGRIAQWGVAEQKAVDTLYQKLQQIEDSKLTSSKAPLPVEMFWSID